MLLCSSWCPGFRLEKLGSKLYADGCFADWINDKELIEYCFNECTHSICCGCNPF